MVALQKNFGQTPVWIGGRTFRSNSYGGNGITSEESTPDAVTTQQKPPKN